MTVVKTTTTTTTRMMRPQFCWAFWLSSFFRGCRCAPVLLKNARIYTVDDGMPWADEILFDDETGLIEAVGGGTGARIESVLQVPPGTVEIDLEGLLVLPGFQDAHLHAVESGINSGLCLFDPDAAVGELNLYFDQQDASNGSCPTGGQFGDQGWIVGVGVDVGMMLEAMAADPSQEYPIAVLDRHFPDAPVLVLDAIGHGALANSAAMAAVGYDVMEGNPPGGMLDRDPTTGELTGVVLENAQQPLRDAAFPPTLANEDAAYRSLLDALATLRANGITSVSDAGGFWRQAQTEAWERAESEGRMTVRASNALYVYPDAPLEEQLPELIARFSDDAERLVRFNQAKIYVDGILSLATGAVYDPYLPSLGLDPDDEFGFEYFGDSLNHVSSVLSDAGFQLHFHVTGDRGAGLALDAVEASNPGPGPHRLTHCYLVDETDRGRFAELDVVADLQAAPSSVGADYAYFMAENCIGADRAGQLVPLAELHDAGATVTLSSDWDADTLSPLVKIQTVLTRPDGRNLPDVEAVIPMLTKNVAALLKTNTGVLAPGKLADIVILDRDIFEMPVDRISEAQVLVTIFNGKVVYDPDGIVVTEDVPQPSQGFRATPLSLWALFLSAILAAVLVRP